MDINDLTLRKIARTFGVEVGGLDLNEVPREELASLRELLIREKLLIIRGQELSNARLSDIGRALGRPMRSAFSNGVDGFPEIVEIRRSADQVAALSTMWHSDSTYLQSPPTFSLLVGDEIPPFGGHTSFSDTVAAFSDLSDPLKNFLRNLKVVARSDKHEHNDRYSHVSMPSKTEHAEVYEAIHPAVCVNKDNGDEAVYVNEEHSIGFDGMSVEESRPIIDYLVRHIQQDRYRTEVTWTKGMLVISDNRSTQHRAIDNYFGHSRLLRRLIVRNAE